jgi:hypothetical protein
MKNELIALQKLIEKDYRNKTEKKWKILTE